MGAEVSAELVTGLEGSPEVVVTAAAICFLEVFVASTGVISGVTMGVNSEFGITEVDSGKAAIRPVGVGELSVFNTVSGAFWVLTLLLPQAGRNRRELARMPKNNIRRIRVFKGVSLKFLVP